MYILYTPQFHWTCRSSNGKYTRESNVFTGGGSSSVVIQRVVGCGLESWCWLIANFKLIRECSQHFTCAMLLYELVCCHVRLRIIMKAKFEN
ncbi:hypothetical protein GOP47_0021878 [Adiantum capillus-veneris]|uniref:Uncharacterized protein n=1 Tax=Adiantum capillus-veneris TaxID=13818 RepID=A0A9D4UAD0_ADICA|nr:hypothetical protein GOP47_0021878 [Adiantum capillus-veneris]